MCIILSHEKTTLPIQDILGVNFLYLGAFFSVWGKFVWEKSSIYISVSIFIFFGQFSVEGNLCFRGFFNLGKFVYGKAKGYFLLGA